MVSFDELEALSGNPITQEAPVTMDSLTHKGDVGGEKDSAKEPETPPSKEEPVPEAAEVTEEVEHKTYEATAGEEALEVRADAEFEVKIRGENQKVSLEDLRNNYSGKTDWSKKYNELNKEKQDFDRDKGDLQSYVDQLHDKLVVKKDPMGAIWLLAEAMGGSPGDVVSEFQKQVLEQVNQLSDLSPEERRIKELEDSMSLRKRQEDESQSRYRARREQEEAIRKQNEALDKYGLDKDTFNKTYFKLIETGDVDPNQLPADIYDVVGKAHTATKHTESIGNLLDEVNPELSDKQDAVSDLSKVMRDYPAMTVTELRDIAVEVYGSSKAKNLSKKLKKTQPAQTTQAAPSPSDDLWSFDQL